VLEGLLRSSSDLSLSRSGRGAVNNEASDSNSRDWADLVEGLFLLSELFLGNLGAVQQRLRCRGQDRSRALLENGMAGCPEGPACMLAASWLLQKTNRLESCEALLLEGTQHDDASNVVILLRLARVSLLLGRVDAALEALRRALGFAATATTAATTTPTTTTATAATTTAATATTTTAPPPPTTTAPTTATATLSTSANLVGSLLAGPAEVGLCHILMCIAVHQQRRRNAGTMLQDPEQCRAAEGVEHLRQGLQLRPSLAKALARSVASACTTAENARPAIVPAQQTQPKLPSSSSSFSLQQQQEQQQEEQDQYRQHRQHRQHHSPPSSPVSSTTSTSTCFLPRPMSIEATATAEAEAAAVSSLLLELRETPCHYDLDFTMEEANILVLAYKAFAEGSTSTMTNRTRCSDQENICTSASNSTKTSASLAHEPCPSRCALRSDTAISHVREGLKEGQATQQGFDLKTKPRSLVASMVTTASTTEPLSSNPSREVSCRGLPEVNLTVPSISLPPCELANISDVDFQECLCGGRFSFIYHGRYRSQEVAIKVHREQRSCDAAMDADSCQDLLNEINILSKLRHPCIVSFAGACLDTNSVALIMELVPGGNLHQALHVQHMPLTRIQEFAFAKDLLMALSFLHGRQHALVHLDVKSANLLISAEGQHLKLCDFELAQRADASSEQSLVGLESRGSPRYMSPERHDANLGPVTTAADIWSAGCVLVEVFAHILPYADCNVRQLMRTMLVLKRAPLVPKFIEAAVRGSIHCALAFQPHERLRASQILMQIETVERSCAP